ncbi:hypothetical protein [Desulfosporosinus metallidurans]|uniref:hypothetical protein n=1 Tax=Desulfosporosinus metallidurans TaxID=1888891 RepID=UPI000AD82E79|nr:hypothetical protein [Desulfosporosinus metallidurans]
MSKNIKKDSKSTIKIIVPILIIAIIVGIFLLKSNQEKPLAANIGDFALEATVIDLAQQNPMGYLL